MDTTSGWSLLLLLSVLLFSFQSTAFGQIPDTLLAVAARDGDLQSVKALLAEGYDPDAGFEEWTPLMLAAMNGELEIATMLVEAGASLNIRNGDYGTALGVAAMSPLYPSEGESALAQLLVENGTEIDAGNGASMTPLMFAIREGKVEIIKYLIEQGADASWQDVRGWTPLRFAVRTGEPAIVRLILDAGADPNVKEEYPFLTPLHHAVMMGQEEIVAALLDAGADPNGLTEGDAALLVPIVSATADGNLGIVRLLLEQGANPNYYDNGYVNDELSERFEEYQLRTSLDWARLLGYKDIEEALLEAGALTSEELENALFEMFVAINDGEDEDFEELMEKKIDPRIPAPTVEGDISLLDKAAELGRTEIVAMILDNWEVNQFRIETAYEAARVRGEEGVIDLFIERRPTQMVFTAIVTGDTELLARVLESSDGIANCRDEKDVTALFVAAETGSAEMVQMLLDAGAFPDDMGGWEETAIFGAIRQGYTEIAAMLLEAAPALIEMPNRSGMTPLAAAARAGEIESMRLLLDAGSDLDYPDNWGWRPLHHAAWMGHVDAVRFLLEAGADPEAETNSGETPLDLADIADNPEVVEMLK